MGRKVWMVIALAGLASMLVIVGASTLLGGCSKLMETASGSTMPMKCHWTFMATTFVGIIGVATTLLALLSNTKEGRRTAGISSFVTAVVAIILTTPLGIGLCGSLEMHCRQSALVLWIAAGVVLVIAAAQIAKADPQKADLPKMSL